jgi:TPP-dependent pyruvate/acetoin dehydrogenase alpha subunit
VYRTKEEVEEEKRRDPIVRLASQLQAEGALDPAGYDALDAEVLAEAEAAVHFAEESPDPGPEQLTAHVLAE